MLNLEDTNDQNISTRKDAQQSRKRLDTDTVESLKTQFTRFDVFKIPVSEKGIPIIQQDCDMQEGESRLQLTSIATNDVATTEIQQDMLSAENMGMQLVLKHVNSWFVKKDVLFFDSLKKNNTKTLKTMYQTKVQGKQDEQKVIKADRKLLQHLTASMAGQHIKMDEVLQHELSSLPLSLARINGDMNSTSKSDMTDILMGNIEVQYNIPAQEDLNKTCVVIDGHALIQALGKPHNCKTFQDYATMFFKAVTKHINATVKGIDVLFDTYIENSIKAEAQAKTNNKKRLIRRIIDRGDLPLPQVWANFISLSDNKADLANFLSQYAEGCKNPYSSE